MLCTVILSPKPTLQLPMLPKITNPKVPVHWVLEPGLGLGLRNWKRGEMKWLSSLIEPGPCTKGRPAKVTTFILVT